MSIEPVATGQSLDAAKKTAGAASNPAVPFADVLSKSAPGEPVSAATAAEILRLKMLNSAISLGGDQEKPASANSQAIQGLLDRFLEQLPKGSSAVGVPTGDAAPVAGAGIGDGVAAISADDGGAAAAPASVDAIIQKASRRYGIDGGLIKAVIKAESDFNPRAVSPVGAQGLMQLMPSTARGLGVTDAFDPEQNVMAGTRFLKDMLQRYGGNVDEALAAYNWGPGNVDRHGTDRLPRETRTYLATVKGYYNRYVA
jgi:soluble lytic murein transglycosylase-like protein